VKRGGVRLGPTFLATAALIAAGLAGCSSDPSQRVCVDANGTRVEDTHCGDEDGFHSSAGHSWYYYGHSSAVPPVGGKVSGGSYVRPAGKTSTVSRGGFGGRSSSGS